MACNVGLANAPHKIGHTVSSNISMLWATGKTFKPLKKLQKNSLLSFTGKGGVILLDPLDDKSEFAEQAQGVMRDVFGEAAVRKLPATHPLVTGKFAGGIGNDLSKCSYRGKAAKETGKSSGPPILYAAMKKGRVTAVVSKYSLALPSSGNSKKGAAYSQESAMRIVINVILYACASRERSLE
jgi:hypothetical protein